MRPLTYWLAAVAAVLALLHALVWLDTRGDGAALWRSIERCAPEATRCWS